MQISQEKFLNESRVKPVLVCYLKQPDMPDTSEEFCRLVESAGYSVVELFKCNDKPINKSYFSLGHINNIQHTLDRIKTAKLVIIGDVLSPPQHSFLRLKLKKYRIMDKFELVLRLFGSRTAKRETVLELQLAALKYQRSFRNNFLLESKFELDKMGYGKAEHLNVLEVPYSRMGWHKAIELLEKKVEKLRRSRDNQRKLRIKKSDKGDLITISVVGYTNAGKSSFLNGITNSNIEMSKNLFTTLTTTTRMFYYDDLELTLTDTVGFIENLPEALKIPFTSTLEETLISEKILLLIDISEPISEIDRKISASFSILESIESSFLDNLWILFTKKDLVPTTELIQKREKITELIKEREILLDINSMGSISSFENDFNDFLALIDKDYPQRSYELSIPFNRPELLSYCYDNFTIINKEQTDISWTIKLLTRKISFLNAFVKRNEDLL